MTANERRRKIIKILYESKFTTREVLANACRVSKRTIDYDIVLLALEYPIYTMQGYKGGIYIAKEFVLQRRCLTSGQVELLKEMIQEFKGKKREVLQVILQKFTEGRAI